MEMWQEIFCSILQNEKTEIIFPQAPDLEKVFENKCYKALCEIKAILEDDGICDEDCFMRIEEIMSVFSNIGSPVCNRHDFG